MLKLKGNDIQLFTQASTAFLKALRLDGLQIKEKAMTKCQSNDQVSCALTWVHFHELVRQFVSDLLKPFLVTLLLSRYQVVVDTPTLVGTLDHLYSDQGLSLIHI